MLADFASIREGMLNVVSAGVTRMFAPTFPFGCSAWLAMVFVLPPDVLDRIHTGTMTIKYAEGDIVAKAEFQIQPNTETLGAFNPGENMMFPAVVPLIGIPFPHAGQVDINIDINGAFAGLLTFWIVEQPVPTPE